MGSSKRRREALPSFLPPYFHGERSTRPDFLSTTRAQGVLTVLGLGVPPLPALRRRGYPASSSPPHPHSSLAVQILLVIWRLNKPRRCRRCCCCALCASLSLANVCAFEISDFRLAVFHPQLQLLRSALPPSPPPQVPATSRQPCLPPSPPPLLESTI